MAELTGDKWINAAAFPQMIFKSTGVALTGPNTADVTGDFSATRRHKAGDAGDDIQRRIRWPCSGIRTPVSASRRQAC